MHAHCVKCISNELAIWNWADPVYPTFTALDNMQKLNIHINHFTRFLTSARVISCLIWSPIVALFTNTNCRPWQGRDTVGRADKALLIANHVFVQTRWASYLKWRMATEHEHKIQQEVRIVQVINNSCAGVFCEVHFSYMITPMKREHESNQNIKIRNFRPPFTHMHNHVCSNLCRYQCFPFIEPSFVFYPVTVAKLNR